MHGVWPRPRVYVVELFRPLSNHARLPRMAAAMGAGVVRAMVMVRVMVRVRVGVIGLGLGLGL